MALLRAFEGEDPLVILDRIVARDPLEMGRRCGSWLRDHAFLIDPARLLGEALVEVAAEASLGDLPEDGRAWIEQRLERAAMRLLGRDAEGEREGSPGESPDSHAFLIDYFGVTPGTERLAAVRFNALPQEVRKTFFDVVVGDRTPRELARRSGRPLAEIAEQTWEGLLALGLVGPGDKDLVVSEMIDGDTRGGDWL